MLVTEKGEQVEALNQQFVSVGPKLTVKIKTTPSDNLRELIKSKGSTTLILKPVTNSRVLKSL